jgi:hypothetical protein
MPPLGGRSGWDAVLTLLGDPLGGSLDEGVSSSRSTEPPSPSQVSTAACSYAPDRGSFKSVAPSRSNSPPSGVVISSFIPEAVVDSL